MNMEQATKLLEITKKLQEAQIRVLEAYTAYVTGPVNMTELYAETQEIASLLTSQAESVENWHG